MTRQNAASGADAPYDLAVVGAGSAGFSAAIAAAEDGARVALVGHGTIGGTCVNIGCVPSKALIRAMDAVHQANAANRFAGVEASARVVDWAALAAQKQDLVDALRQAKYIDLLPGYDGVAYRQGEARFDNGGLLVDGAPLRAERIVIATGARAAAPDIPGIEATPWLDSTAALDLTELPATMLVVGGGYIGCELAQVFARAGVAVTVVCRSRLLPRAEPEIGAELRACFAAEGIEVVSGVRYRAIRAAGRGVELELSRSGEIMTLGADKLIGATGRRPNTEALGLAEADIQTNPGGGVRVDDRMRTTRPGVYAAGDVTGTDEFVYMAAYGAKIAARNALNGDSLVYDNTAMPAVVFTDPQVASVGLTQAEAVAAGHDARASVLPLSQVPRALAARDARGLVKLVADRRSDRLLGAHIIAPEGADSIQTAAMAIKFGLTTAQLGDTIFPYLTTVEALKLAAQTFDKDISKLSCCAG